MSESVLNQHAKQASGSSRRELFRQGGLLTLVGALPSLGETTSRTAMIPATKSTELYHSIGVHPVINAKGTFTIISGSQTLPEVKQAMDEASRSYVEMDELMDGVGKELAELTGAEWGIVTAGCCAALMADRARGRPDERVRSAPDGRVRPPGGGSGRGGEEA